MNFVEFAKLIRLSTKTNSSTFTDSDILIYANIFKDDICEQIAKKVGEDFFGLRWTRDLVAGQREYDLPDEVIKIKYVEAMLDGIKWKKLDETDLSTYGKSTDENTIKEVYEGKNPEYELFDRSIFIFSEDTIISVEDGLKLWAIIYPVDFTSLSGTEDMSVAPDDYSHGFPRQFHELLARRISIAYKSSKDRPIPLSEKEKLYEVDLDEKIQSMKDANLDRSVEPSVPYDDGSNY